MIDKHELLGFECLESRHTFAVEDVALIEFTTTDGRSGHFWYDSHVDPSPYEGVTIDESEQTLIGYDLITSGPYTHGTLMGQQLIEGKISVDTEAEFFFDNKQYQDPGVVVEHDLSFDWSSRKIQIRGDSISFYADVPNQNRYFTFSFSESEPTDQYLSDRLSQPVLPKSPSGFNIVPGSTGWVSKTFLQEGQPINLIGIRTR